MRVSVLLFPGSNCDHDVVHAFSTVLSRSGSARSSLPNSARGSLEQLPASEPYSVETIWHRDRDLKRPDLVVLPGGFSFGDYLRTGALARMSPAVESVVAFAKSGGSVLGICNGFQILCEVGLLPGALLRNVGCSFLSRPVHLRVEVSRSMFSPVPMVSGAPQEQHQRESAQGAPHVVTCPIAHGEGNYFADRDTLERLEKQHQVVFRYCSESGEVAPENRETNPNGSLNAIAGICNEQGNVTGLMPHPERAIESLVGGRGGQSCLTLLQRYCAGIESQASLRA